MTILTHRLRKMATVATPGPWEASATNSHVIKGNVHSGHGIVIANLNGSALNPPIGQCGLNAVFIAAVNPETILKLCDAIENMETAIDNAILRIEELDILSQSGSYYSLNLLRDALNSAQVILK